MNAQGQKSAVVMASKAIAITTIVSVTLSAVAWAKPAQVYSCVDAQGRRITADRPIRQCADRAQREFSTGTGAQKMIQPRKTENERMQEIAEAKAEQERVVIEERRKNEERLLIARFPTVESFMAHRQVVMTEVNAKWADTRASAAAVEQERAQIGEGKTLAQRKRLANLKLQQEQLQTHLNKASGELQVVLGKLNAQEAVLLNLWNKN